MEHSKAQTALMARDAELERRAVEVSSLQSDKAQLDKLLQVGGPAVAGNLIDNLIVGRAGDGGEDGRADSQRQQHAANPGPLW